jgi:hypothetical protein
VHYVSYLLDLTTSRAVDGTIEYAPNEMVPANGFIWKIVSDTDGNVVVRGMVNNRLIPIATASWQQDVLAKRKQREASTPNDRQWTLVQTTLAERLTIASAQRPAPVEPILEPFIELDHEPPPIDPEDAKPFEPRPKKVAPEWHSRNHRSKQVRLLASIGGFVMIGGILLLLGYALYVDNCQTRSKDDKAVVAPVKQAPIDAAVFKPPTIDERVASATSLADALAIAQPISTTLVARYAAAKLRFAEVDAAETNLGLVEKDHRAELGKRMCVEGEIRRIERADMDSRKVFVGELLVRPEDRITFLAVGSTGTLVKRDAARFCGVVTGKLELVGMFDLAENRAPSVEQ